MKVTLAAAAVLSCGLVAACGTESSDPPPPRSAPAEWQTERLDGEVAVDFPTLLVSDGDDALVLMVSDDGRVQSHVSIDGAAFEEGAPLELGEKYAALGDVVRLADGSWFALGNAGVVETGDDEELSYDPIALRSRDGLTWERVEVAGFTDAVELTDLEVVGGRIVAAGDYRTLANPGSGGFEARVWTSTDGRSFDEVTLPDVPDYQGYDDESYVGDVVTTDGVLLASGRIGDDAVIWQSDDAGDSWARVTDPILDDVYSISGLEAVGSVVVASTSGTDTSAIRSTDGGRTWAAVTALPLEGEAEGWAPLWVGADRFFTLTGIDDMSWSRPEVCYADLEQCGYERRPQPRLVTSEDGAIWSAVDVPGSEVDEVAGTADGRTLVMTAERGGVAVHTWPSGAELPESDQPAGPRTVDLVTLPEGAEPEVGVRYHEPMYVHCGMEWLWFGDATWRRTDDGPGLETGAGEGAPEGWPLVEGQQTLYGFATVRADGVLEYSLEDGTVIATYQRRDGAPGCD
ncbi:WD40/YVTN/BNR-like repeat-containing protein [Nocardioides pelophilus]|uniref:WD40/YVTN/BNR-like repeat-containing protein n=1 Tax=Nocardioides pelophilus TaxID=2172019 RepID=UPI001600A419|nr:hypothetical protein [Nocardioides pelophilus]